MASCPAALIVELTSRAFLRVKQFHPGWLGITQHVLFEQLIIA